MGLKKEMVFIDITMEMNTKVVGLVIKRMGWEHIDIKKQGIYTKECFKIIKKMVKENIYTIMEMFILGILLMD